MKYDYMIAGRWRNHEVIRPILESIRSAGKTAYCFIENSYSGNGIELDADDKNAVEGFMNNLETLSNWQSNQTYRAIFNNDMNGIREAKEFLLVFPAGASAHMELGAAYGMGKKCYAIGEPEKYETLYLMLEKIYPNVEEFLKDRHGVLV